MSLRSALVDRAQVLANRPQPARVEGRTIHAWVAGEWFRARLTEQEREWAPDSGGKLQRVVDNPRLMYGMRDLTGNDVVLDSGMRVRVKSRELGIDAVYLLDTDPKPIRKKRRLIGHTVGLRRVEPHESDTVIP
jgi:hypothetical protein